LVLPQAVLARLDMETPAARLAGRARLSRNELSVQALEFPLAAPHPAPAHRTPVAAARRAGTAAQHRASQTHRAARREHDGRDLRERWSLKRGSALARS